MMVVNYYDHFVDKSHRTTYLQHRYYLNRVVVSIPVDVQNTIFETTIHLRAFYNSFASRIDADEQIIDLDEELNKFKKACNEATQSLAELFGTHIERFCAQYLGWLRFHNSPANKDTQHRFLNAWRPSHNLLLYALDLYTDAQQVHWHFPSVEQAERAIM